MVEIEYSERDAYNHELFVTRNKDKDIDNV